MVITIYSVESVYETLRYWTWIYRMKTTPRTEDIQLIWDSSSGEPIGYASGFSKFFKTMLVIFQVIPKLFFAATLWFYGAKFVNRSENDEEMILNVVAAIFVLEIDNQLYKVTVPE